MILPNIENFIGCDSSFEEAEIVLFGAPFYSTTSFHDEWQKDRTWLPDESLWSNQRELRKEQFLLPQSCCHNR